MFQDHLLAGLNKMAKINVHVHRSDRKNKRYVALSVNGCWTERLTRELFKESRYERCCMLMQINSDHLRYLSQLCMTRINFRFAVGAVRGERLLMSEDSTHYNWEVMDQ